jgi:hypothetical protein
LTISNIELECTRETTIQECRKAENAIPITWRLSVDKDPAVTPKNASPPAKTAAHGSAKSRAKDLGKAREQEKAVEKAATKAVGKASTKERGKF